MEGNSTLAMRTPLLMDIFKGVGGMFYLHDLEETSFKRHEDVPPFFKNAWPYFVIFIFLENLILWYEKKPLTRLNDGLTSVSHGILQECGRMLFRGGEGALYIYINENYRFLDLNWRSPVTWYLALVGVDFCYYWVHRASHEVTIFWAQHQVHHSSEDFNLAVGLRQSVLQGWCSFMFYLPLALVIPSAHFFAHQQFNLLYQFWIHTRAIDSLGPLEWIFNTPKHHRVHHGCNLYCIDKNYGGFLIIWDRIFGTFADERPKEDIVYGLVFNEPSFNPLFLQVFYNKNVVLKWKSVEGWKNKLSSLIKGPSWTPGAPWTGIHEEKLDIRRRDKYDVVIPQWCNIYIAFHFTSILVGFHSLLQRHMFMHPLTVLSAVIFILISLTVFGMLFENRRYANVVEGVRCIALLVLGHKFALFSSNSLTTGVIHALFAASVAMWLLQGVKSMKVKGKGR